MSTLFSHDDSPPLTISEVTAQVQVILEDNFPEGVHLVGEVSNLARPASGHLYLKLKDSKSQINAVIFRGVALRLRFDLEDGMEVFARGRMTVYTPRGEYQLQVEWIEPKGIGPLELAFRQLKERLSAQGYFLPQRKKSLPEFPTRVALLTSATGAAVRDVLEILRRRWPALDVWVCPVPVQGEGAAGKIAEMIDRLNGLDGAETIDAMIVGRGGGSLEDLWAFNEEVVADAIFRSKIPVVSGVGHETDLTIADLVADVRALTPSEAAERVTPNREEIRDWLVDSELRMRALLAQQLELAQQRLTNLASRRCFRQPVDQIRQQEQRLDDLTLRLQRAFRQNLAKAEQRLGALTAQLESLSPLKVLQRGYSLTRTENEDRLLSDAEQVQPGERIVTRLAQGQLISRVEEVVPE